ncbi:3-ketoacyl-CoA thiolase FadA (plasmid) [Cupriavidus necator N-1]|uniref:3-ketoacyl-CoA thiolase FadA n=2 Tax=Cupriavidus necator TaxID=106590 RepID=F8GWW0_CUPNN|nr:3-ketoacyl-CoA thiolase FadA [Cupriavidus necator N-1]
MGCKDESAPPALPRAIGERIASTITGFFIVVPFLFIPDQIAAHGDGLMLNRNKCASPLQEKLRSSISHRQNEGHGESMLDKCDCALKQLRMVFNAACVAIRRTPRSVKLTLPAAVRCAAAEKMRHVQNQ